MSLIALFLKLDIDKLIAGRTAPNHSWANIVERIIKHAWLKSIQPMINILNERHERMTLKENGIKSGKPASDADIDNLERYLIAKVDPEIKIGEYSAKELSTKKSYNSWMKENSLSLQFSNKEVPRSMLSSKESDVEFNWVPDPMFADEKKEHYQPFAKAYGTETTEKDCPSTSVESIVALA